MCNSPDYKRGGKSGGYAAAVSGADLSNHSMASPLLIFLFFRDFTFLITALIGDCNSHHATSERKHRDKIIVTMFW